MTIRHEDVGIRIVVNLYELVIGPIGPTGAELTDKHIAYVRRRLRDSRLERREEKTEDESRGQNDVRSKSGCHHNPPLLVGAFNVCQASVLNRWGFPQAMLLGVQFDLTLKRSLDPDVNQVSNMKIPSLEIFSPINNHCG